jgi:hypothetical protein
MLYGEDLVKEVYPQALEAALIESEGGDMPSGTFYGTPVSSPALPPTGGGTMTSTSIQTLTDAVTSAKPIWDAQSNVPLMSIDGLAVPTEFGVVTPQGIAVINSISQPEAMGELEGGAVAMPISDTEIASPVSMIEPSTGLPETMTETDVSVITRPSDVEDAWQFTDLAATAVTAPISDSRISTERQTMTVPEVLSQTDIIQQPALVTDQVAVTTPIPIPVAQPIPETIKRPIPKIPILADDEEMSDAEKREAFRGSIVWRQGIVWHAWKYPYEDDEKDLATFYKEPPPGAVIIPGAKTAQETIQFYLGDTPPPPDRIINMGIMDISISTTPDGQLQIRYAEDAKQARGDKDAWFEGKEKKGAHTSRKKKKAEVESVSATNNDDFWSGSV